MISKLRDSFADLVVTDKTFPSGALVIDVRMNDRAWVLMYSPQHDTYGIDELRDDDGFDTGYTHSALTFVDASRILTELLRTAAAAG